VPGFVGFCEGEYGKSQLLFILDGILINASIILTTGVFLSGYIVLIDASDLLAGILNNANVWGSIIALSSFLIYERMEKRKNLLLAFSLVSRLMVCSIILLPLISNNRSFIIVSATIMIVLGNILWSFYGIGANVWVTSIVSQDKRNEFIFLRTLWLRISFTSVSIIAGFVLDWFHKGYTGFLVIYISALVFAITDAAVLWNIKEPPNPVSKSVALDAHLFFEPFKNRKYKSFLSFIFLFYLGLTLSNSFTPIYLIRYLKLDYGFITSVNVIMYLLMILSTRVWSRIESRKGLQFVIKVSVLFVVSEVLVYSFLTNDTYFLLFLAPVLSGIGYGGFNIAVFTYRYEIMPEGNKTIYEGWFGAVYGLSVFIAPVVGNFIMKMLPEISNPIYQHSSFQLLYLISFILSGTIVLSMLYRNEKL